MSRKFSVVLILVLLIISSSVLLQAQSPAGTWVDARYNITIILHGNYTYSMQHSNGNSTGQWRNQANQLCFYDSSVVQPICYTILKYSSTILNIQDVNGAVLNLVRKQTQSKSNSSNIIAQKGGIALSQIHFQHGIDLIQFIIGGRIKSSEIIELKNQLIKEFNISPDFIVKELLSIGASMQKVRNSTDVVKIGSVRQNLFSMLYKSTSHIAESNKPLIIQIINRYIKVLAIDNQNNLILTNRDIDGYINYIVFNSQLSGNNIQVNQNVINSTRQQLINSFSSMNIEQKKILASSSLIWELAEANWKRLTPTQKQQYMLSYQSKVSSHFKYQQPQANYNLTKPGKKKSIYQMQSEMNAKQNMFTMMQNMNTDSHALSMNIIENIGGTGNYWEVVDY